MKYIVVGVADQHYYFQPVNIHAIALKKVFFPIPYSLAGKVFFF